MISPAIIQARLKSSRHGETKIAGMAVKATPAENNAVDRGSLSRFGDYANNEDSRSFTFELECRTA